VRWRSTAPALASTGGPPSVSHDPSRRLAVAYKTVVEPNRSVDRTGPRPPALAARPESGDCPSRSRPLRPEKKRRRKGDHFGSAIRVEGVRQADRRRPAWCSALAPPLAVCGVDRPRRPTQESNAGGGAGVFLSTRQARLRKAASTSAGRRSSADRSKSSGPARPWRPAASSAHGGGPRTTAGILGDRRAHPRRPAPPFLGDRRGSSATWRHHRPPGIHVLDETIRHPSSGRERGVRPQSRRPAQQRRSPAHHRPPENNILETAPSSGRSIEMVHSALVGGWIRPHGSTGPPRPRLIDPADRRRRLRKSRSRGIFTRNGGFRRAG